MPAFTFSVPHKLGKQEARNRLENLIPQLQTKYANLITESEYDWHGDECEFNLKVKGLNFSGAVGVQESQVDISLNLPFAAMFFKDKIQQTIESQSKILLGPGKN